MVSGKMKEIAEVFLAAGIEYVLDRKGDDGLISDLEGRSLVHLFLLLRMVFMK